MTDLSSLTPAQLYRAADIKEKIAKLESELAGVFGEAPRRKPGRPRKDVTSTALSGPTQQKRRKMSAAGRARIVAAMKARWLKAKKAGKKSL